MIRKLNDDERELWVKNDQNLYTIWLESKHTIKVWIRKNRKLIDNYIKGELS